MASLGAVAPVPSDGNAPTPGVVGITVVDHLSVALVPGSSRAASIHRRLASVMAVELVRMGVTPDVVDLADHPLPIYHGDEEAASGPPDAAVELHDRLAAHDGVILLSPEYNGGPSALLKNAIDWVTRVERATLRRPLVGFAAASPGGRGGVNGLAVLRSIGEHMRLDLVDEEFSLPDAGDAIQPDGEGWLLATDEQRERLDRWLSDFVDRLRSRRASVERGIGR
jgi:chromate reductase